MPESGINALRMRGNVAPRPPPLESSDVRFFDAQKVIANFWWGGVVYELTAVEPL